MSIKFLSGLHDLLGLQHDESSGNTQPLPISSVIASASGSTSQQNQPQRRRSVTAINAALNESADSESVQKCSHSRRVRFPEESDLLVTGRCPAPNNGFSLHHDPDAPPLDLSDTLSAYVAACLQYGVPTCAIVEQQIMCFHRSSTLRQEGLSLKGERVSPLQMEALEEIFRRVQVEQLDLEYTFLDDESVVTLAEFLEFYDSATRLNLSFNRQLTQRAWSALFRATRYCSLAALNLRYTSVGSERSLPSLCRALRAPSAISCLHLENCQLAGKGLLLLVCALKTNTTVRELYLGENNLQSTDGIHLHQLIVSNTTLQMLDLRNNTLADMGTKHVCDALRNPETVRRSALAALVLWNNRITADTMDCLARALRENGRLETLNLGSNALGCDGTQKLRSALMEPNCKLARLGLQATRLDDQAAIVLAECFADNRSLIRLDLRDNAGIGPAGLIALAIALRMNSNITALNLDPSCTKSKSDANDCGDEWKRHLDQIATHCELNRKAALAAMSASAVATTGPSTPNENDAGATSTTATSSGGESTSTSNESTPDRERSPPPAKSPAVAEEAVTSSTSTTQTSGPASSARPPKGTRRRTKSTSDAKLVRSSSLTCDEPIADLSERIRLMSASSHSLDDCETPTTVEPPHSLPPVVESPSTSLAAPKPPPLSIETRTLSLPELTQSEPSSAPTSAVSTTTATSVPATRKFRRFSVSPSTSINDVGPTTVSSMLASTALRPQSLPLMQSSSSTLPAVHLRLTPLLFVRTPTGGTPSESAEERGQQVARTVSDLIHYVVYEESRADERKRSLLLGADVYRILNGSAMPGCSSAGSTPLSLTPSSSMSRLIEDDTTPGNETDAQSIGNNDFDDDQLAVEVTVKGLVRQVVRDELARRRRRIDRRSTTSAPICTTPTTPTTEPTDFPPPES